MAQLLVIPRFLGVLLILLGGVVFYGWMMDVPPLQSIHANWATMKVNTALCFLFSGVALNLLGRGHRRHRLWVRLSAALIVIFGFTDLLEYMAPVQFGLDELLVADPYTNPAALAGRMSVMTAICFMLYGVAFYLETTPAININRLSQSLALAGIIFSMLALIGYVYGVGALYKTLPYASMALHTAAAFFIIGMGLLCLRPKAGVLGILTSRCHGGSMARTLLPAAFAIPFIFGWVILAGERAQWYDSEFGLAAFAVANIMMFAIVIIASAISLHRSDLARQASEHALRDADRRKDEFLAILAHELRNPLAPMRSALHAMRLSPDPKRCLEAQETMEHQLSHMVRLIDDLLDVSLIASDKIVLRKERVSLQAIIQQVSELCAPLMQEKKHKLSIRLPETPIWVKGDSARLVQAIANIVDNSGKYTEAGGVIGLTVETNASMVHIRISDNGIGIPPDMIVRIFDMFSQVDNSISRTHGGLGIGLGLVKRLLEAHGGSVCAISGGDGKGSEFTVTLPTVSALSVVDISPEPVFDVVTPPASSATRVLVVDDNVDSAKTLGWMMELFGYEFKLAHDGEAAIATAREWKPHVVLLDIGLPGMDGYEVCRTLRPEPALASTLFIAQSGWGQQEHRLRSKEAGFHHHLVKPIEMPILKKLLAGLRLAA